MNEYFRIITEAYTGYADWLWKEITNPGLNNYFYWLLAISGFFFLLEIMRPWRKHQAKFRKDFWLDFFYMFFNFFLFSLIIYNAASEVLVSLINDFLALFGITNLVAFEIGQWHPVLYYLFFFFLADFMQWNIHRLLHRNKFLWEFHKVHHSVKEMGFAAHLRFHWMETIVYKSIQYIPLALLGFTLVDLFALHILNLTIGHFNHSNISVNKRIKGLIAGLFIGVVMVAYGSEAGGLIGYDIAFTDLSLIWKIIIPLTASMLGYFLLGSVIEFMFNSPEMHIWHHAKYLPSDRKYGVNFGISLGMWDRIFGTYYQPKSGRDIELGFDGMDDFPENLSGQLIHGIIPQRKKQG